MSDVVPILRAVRKNVADREWFDAAMAIVRRGPFNDPIGLDVVACALYFVGIRGDVLEEVMGALARVDADAAREVAANPEWGQREAVLCMLDLAIERAEKPS